MLGSAKKSEEKQTFKLSIPNISCEHCIGRVQKTLQPFALDSKSLTIHFNPNDKKSSAATITVSKTVKLETLVNAVSKLVGPLGQNISGKAINKPALLFSEGAKGKSTAKTTKSQNARTQNKQETSASIVRKKGVKRQRLSH